MANLKALKIRIKSVKSTQKITKAMKMVAAARLRRAQEAAEQSRPYSQRMEEMLISVAKTVKDKENGHLLFTGRKNGNKHLIVVMTSDRGLCGAFNSSIVRAARARIKELEADGKDVKIFAVGRKAADQLRAMYGSKIINRIGIGKKKPTYDDAEAIASTVINLIESGEVDSCAIFYNKFKSAISQITTYQQLVPLDVKEVKEESGAAAGIYEYEPNEEKILDELLPRNIAVQIYHGLLENAASEQAARMTAMDNATRNAGEMIKGLTLDYNRSRQATITKELIEIISGAEAV